MHHHTQLLALTAALLTRTSATPVPAPSSVVNCADVTAGLDPSCWAKLNMTDWIQNWASTSNVDSQVSIETPSDDGIHEPATNVTTGDFTGEGFRKRAPVPSAVVQASPATSTGAAAGCKAQELWSTCFLRLGLGVTGGDCTQIASKTCTAPKVASPPPTAQIYYGMWNIYAINQYLTTWWQTIQTLSESSTGQAALTTAATKQGGIEIFTNSDQTFSIDTPLVDLLIKQTGGHQLPGARNTDLLTLLGNEASTTMYGYDTSIEQVASLMQTRLQEVLTEIMGDVETFVGFAENGAFSTRGMVNETGLVTVLEE